MAPCANKNSPEFKKLVRITNQSPEDVSIAIGMWQDHFQTDDFPDGITLSVMFNNRESYGGIDQYLNAMYRPVKKVDIDAAARSLPQKIDNITKALSLIVPGLKITVHETQDSFTDAVVFATGKTNNQSAAGFYNGGNKEIHLNLPKMVERMSIEKRIAFNTLEHEATHPILDALEAVQPGLINSLHTDLVALEKELGVTGKYTVKFAGIYNQSSQKEEAIVEFIADIASGNLDVRSLPKSQLQKISDFFVKMFAKLGINIGPYVRTGEGVFNLAKQIQKIFDEGKVIAGTTSNPNKTQFQNKNKPNEPANIQRLRPEEEQGRDRSGEINAIATDLLGRVHEAVERTYGKNSDEKATIIDEEEKYLKDFAVEAGIWTNNADKKFGEFYDKGQEQSVYIDPKNTTIVTKLNEASLNNNWLELLDRIALHNTYFPSTAYTIKGFGSKEDGTFVMVLEQPFIRPGNATESDIIEYMKGRGYEMLSKYDNSIKGTIEENRSFIDKKNGIVVEDLHLKNVYKDKTGNMFVIDPVISLDTPDKGYGGTRTVGDVKFQIIGPEGAFALDQKEEGSRRFDNYLLAKKMKAAGKTPREIKDASGWELGSDLKWKYEIPDIKTKTSVNINTFNEAVRARQEIDRLNKEQDNTTDRYELLESLENLYKELGHGQYNRDFNKQVNDALKANDKSLLPPGNLSKAIDRFSSPDYNHTTTAKLRSVVEGPVIEAYPQMKDVTISFEKGMQGYASWNPETKHISISDKLRYDDETIMSAIIHEVQHAVQDFEGFAKGGNVQQFKQFDVEESVLLKNYIDGKQGKDAFLNDPDVSSLIEELDLGVVKNIITQFNKADIKEILRNKNLDAIEQYKRLAGEVEARNAQTRAGYTDEQRRKTLLSESQDIATEDQIFLFNATSIFESQSTTTDPISQTDKISMMSEEGPDYVFFSYGNDSKFNTEPMPFMSNQGYKEKVVRLNKKQVYPLEEDPKELLGAGNIWQQIPQILEKIKALGYRMLVANLDNKLLAFPAGRFTPVPGTKFYESNQVKNSPYSGIKDVNRLIALTEGDPEKLRPFRNYSIELDNALINYDLTKDVDQFKNDLKEIKIKETISIESLLSGNKKVTIFNDLESLQNSEYAYRDSQIRKIESVTKINPIRHSYAWSDQNNAVHNTIVRDGEEETTPVDNKVKFSLTETDNSEGTQTPYDESIKFGNLVQDITAKIKEGISDIVQIKKEANVDTDTAELFQDAFDVANIRAGKTPSNTRQIAIYDMITQLSEEDERVTAQAFYREWANLLDGLGINLLMLKQILPDEEMLKDKNLNQTWKRILDVTKDIGKFVSQTILRGKKFEITDFEGNQTGYWNHAAVGFTDMLAYVQKAVEEDPNNKEKLMANVRKALKENGDDEMLNLLEVAIAASGETNLNDLSKIVRAGSHAGRVLNVIKRYIGGGSFGKIKTDLTAATIMAENDEELAGALVNSTTGNEFSALDLAEEIRTIITLSELSKEERAEFFAENPELIDDVNKFLKRLKLRGVFKKPTDKVIIRKANNKISRGMLSLIDSLKKSNPELVKFSKTSLDPSALKSIKQVLRGLIDIHGTDIAKLTTELDKLFSKNNILLDAADVLNDRGIKEYIANADKHSIRSAVVDKLAISEDNYTKMVLDHILKVLNVPDKATNKIDALADAMDRGELTKQVLDAVRDEINNLEDEDRKQKLLNLIDKKFVSIFEGAVPAKTLNDAISKGLGKITKDIIEQYVLDPDRSLQAMAAMAIDKLGLSPEEATAWAGEVSKKVNEKLAKARKNKIKSILRNKVTDKAKAETIEEKIFKIISTTANPDGTIPTAVEVEGQMLDIKQVIADKYSVPLNDPKAIANIIRLTNLLRSARTQTRKDQIQAEIMLKIKNMKLSPNKYSRILQSGVLELSNFVMANILSGVNSAYKAMIGGFYNSARAAFDDLVVGRAIDVWYKGAYLRKATIDSLKTINKKKPAGHAGLTWRLFYDVMRNGSAAISQSNVPEYGLSNFDQHLNDVFLLRSLYSPFRFLSAIDRATMNLNHNRLAYRRAINSLLEFGKNNVNLHRQGYSRTLGGASWYKVDNNGNPEIDPSTGNIKVIIDKAVIDDLNKLAKENFTQTEFVLEAERILGYSRINEIHKGVISEWNALVDLSNSQTATKEEKAELKRLAIPAKNLVKVTNMDDFKSMDGAIKRFVSLEIHKKVEQNQNAALSRKVHMEAGSYSAQGTEIPGVAAGLLYITATSIDRAIEGAVTSNNLFVKFALSPIVIAIKIYAALITKAPAIGYAASLMYSPITFLMNLVNLGFHMAGRPYIRMSYDAKDKVWRYNGLSMQDIKNATGISNLGPGDLATTTDERVLKVLKEGYTVQSNQQNIFELKNPEIYTIGGQNTKTEIATVLAKQALSQAAFMLLISQMMDCPDDEECEFNAFGKALLDVASLKGWGAMRQWLDDSGTFAKYFGHRPKVDKYGDPQHNTVALTPAIGPVQGRIPLNELNNAIAATTLARINEEIKSGVKMSKHDIMLRYMIYSNFDLLADVSDMMTEGMTEFQQVAWSFFDESYTQARTTKEAAKSVAKRMTAALTPKMFNDVDKFLLDMENAALWSTKAEGFTEQVKRNIPLNVPFLRRYVTENNPEFYEKTPYQYEWTDWQLYLKHQNEPNELDQFGLDTGKYILNDNGRITVKAPNGEVDSIKRNAVSSGKGEYKDNGYVNTMQYFDSLYSQAIKASNINQLLDAKKKEEALDLMRDIAKEVQANSNFTDYKKAQMIPKEEVKVDSTEQVEEVWN